MPSLGYIEPVAERAGVECRLRSSERSRPGRSLAMPPLRIYGR
jgi:hypothetical protein